jgi:hypothetical protein
MAAPTSNCKGSDNPLPTESRPYTAPIRTFETIPIPKQDWTSCAKEALLALCPTACWNPLSARLAGLRQYTDWNGPAVCDGEFHAQFNE